MIRPTASVLVLLGLLATAAGAADPDATVEKDGARNLRGLVNKIVSPLTNQFDPGTWGRKKPGVIDPKYQPTQTIGPDYNPTRPRVEDPIDPKFDPKYNPTMPAPKDDPNYKPGTRNLRGLIGDVTVRKKPGITYNPTRPSPDYQPTLPAPGIIDPLDDPTRTTLDPIKYNPTRPRDIDKYNPTMPPMDDPQYNPTMPAPASF